jgi:hypothetical protein
LTVPNGERNRIFDPAWRRSASCSHASFVFEVNPVLWGRDSAVALDGLLIVG